MKSFRDRLEHRGAAGELRDGDIRYMMIRPDALMGMFKRLPEDERRHALKALGESLVEAGGNSSKRYQALGASDGEKLMQTIIETAGQLGWGSFDIDAEFAKQGKMSLSVANSPFVAGFGRCTHPVCAPIAGMFTAVSGMVIGRRTEVQEVSCASVTGTGHCLFEAKVR